MTDEDLKKLINESVTRVIKSNINRKIILAQKELIKIGSHLSSIGMRLDGAPYNGLYKR